MSTVICPHCGQLVTAVELAVRRFRRVLVGEQTLDDNLNDPGFLADLRLVIEEIANLHPEDRP